MNGSEPATTLACVCVFTGVAIIFSTLRLYSRAIIVRSVHVDDVLVVFAVMCSVALTTLIIFQAYNGLGKHQDILPHNQAINFFKGIYGGSIVYSIGMLFTQTTFLFQYRNFFIGKWLRRSTDAMIVIVTLEGIGTTLALAFQCLPVGNRYIWDPYAPPVSCINYTAFWFFSALFNVVSSLIICALPLPLINSLRLPKRQKRWLLFVFALGFFTCLASGLRIRGLYISVQHDEDDTSYYYCPAATWSSLEMNIGIICSCMPTIKPIVDRVFPELLHEPTRPMPPLRRITPAAGVNGLAGQPVDNGVPLTDKSLGTSAESSSIPTPEKHFEDV
ncbi:hypothetical protein LTR10_018888 [Elasticomyces elasticus]|uniref:Rhodopsin domain-containing protein n=1 Tax=Exophiala sideris TaxID=1016849 RepID=A0ABR0JIP9_9EURO|nr:hypothetical protein LTR10_018888 [Elasticomyces elasticus]KAK5034468.1 hypothetical protein LTS07_003389 [Exophiala sideris]KAK5042765.1 hypothetical protein LTR13_001613 [Exophiala sideris]KAK5065848.1 hypothetical protein LTR69_003398 [Exophiala sideris]KAK5185691.1 hypothetical protein LTR44_001740 [Eurotiomycetes sp. CCFEE 6388]